MADDQLKTYLNSPGAIDPAVEQAIEAEVQHDVEMEAKYGDKPIEAALGGAAASATLGLSDQLLRKVGVDAERLREVRERNPISSGIGEVAGVVAPAFATGGESLAAKGIAEGAVGMKVATGAGKAAEDVVAKLLKDRVRSQATKDIVQKAAQGAAEGAAFGAGQLVDENALGKADLNAQNLVASAGAGALLGAGFGGALGGLKATMPLVRKGIAPIGEKLASAAKNLVDPEQAAMELVGLRPDKLAKIHEYNPTFGEELPEYIVNKLSLKPLTSAEDLMAANRSVRESAGATIGDISAKLDDITAAEPTIMPRRTDIFDRLKAKLDPYREKLELSPSVNRAELGILKDFESDLNKRANLGNANKQNLANYKPEASFKELDDLRKNYQGIKFKGGGAQESFRANMAEVLRSELRNIVDETAASVSASNMAPELSTLANELKSANKDFAMASTLQKSLPKTLNKKALLGLQDVVEGAVIGGATGSGPLGIAVAAARKFGKSDLRRRLTILADIKAQNIAIDKRITEAAKTFVNSAKKPARQLSLKSLINSGFAVDYINNTPAKNRKEALKNVAQNLNNLQTDPDALLKKLAASTARVGQAAPNIAQETQSTLVRSLDFLRNKLPSRGQEGLLFQRPYEPSSMEMSKFERYMQAIEHPLSTLEDLEHGTLTNEHVEALQAVYPAIYREIVQKATDQAVEAQDKLSYGKKVQLSILLGISTDESLQPYAISALQNNFTAQNQSAESPQPTGDASSLNVAERTASNTEKVANRT